MMEKQDTRTIVSQYAEHFLEEHFGEKPDKLTVILHPPFLLIHLTGFLLPAEKMLVQRQDWNRVLETRDLMICSLKADLLTGLQERIGQPLTDLYVDWNLEKKSGLMIATMEKDEDLDEWPWPEAVDQETLKEIILLNSIRTQKKPDQTNFYWLNDQVLLIERIGILVEVEKNLVQNGIIEELRLAKRPLEHRITKLFNLESLLNGRVQDLFVDWNFHMDFSYMVLMLEKPQS
ncbi:Na-translocating system protein MpsC family protein [Planomicrobium sp. CPCC 101079]|uniref:Na-translocating system protein MpsC family protein n=1 Tax=Planomicrobium sp. CPCC 101079 TaxID=2599618 RepID=UPI001645853A|nr:Na-translocating system protein MpsC family protein [Planomicrobium sp. CPCC 101079]